jgi:hypothetical protein
LLRISLNRLDNYRNLVNFGFVNRLEGPNEMKSAAALCIAASLVLGGPAFAAERGGSAATQAPAPACVTLDQFKAAFDAKAKFSVASIGAYHVLKGVYLGSPKTPEGNPPGDGALIVSHPAQHGQQAIDLVAWTRNGGKDVCAGANQVLMIPASVMALIAQTVTGQGETQDPDDSKDELKL